MIYNVSVGSHLGLSQNTIVGNLKTFPFYGTVEDASNYCFASMYWDFWQIASNDERERALMSSSRAIDRLNFQGCRTGLQAFPSDIFPSIPRPIVEACYENALMLLKGLDPETEIRNLSVQRQGFSAHVTHYDRTFVPEYLQCGIVSAAAWANLKPYLRDGRTFNLVRVN